MYDRNAQLLQDAAKNRELLQDIAVELANLKQQYFEYEALQEHERHSKSNSKQAEPPSAAPVDPFTIKKTTNNTVKTSDNKPYDPFTINQKSRVAEIHKDLEEVKIVEDDDFLSTSSMATSETSSSESDSTISQVLEEPEVQQEQYSYGQKRVSVEEKLSQSRERSIDDVLASVPPSRPSQSGVFERLATPPNHANFRAEENSSLASEASKFSEETLEGLDFGGAETVEPEHTSGRQSSGAGNSFQRAAPKRDSSHSSILSWLKIDNKPSSKKDDLDWIIHSDPLDMKDDGKVSADLPPINPVDSRSKLTTPLSQKSVTPVSFGLRSNSQTPQLSSHNTLDNIDVGSESNDSLIDLVQATNSGSQVRFNLGNNSGKQSSTKVQEQIVDEDSISLYSSDSDFAPLPARK